ncbi:MAG: SseB family protein [Clostridiales bacterium]|nr:SseB family protein [Clostridiales bacterium]
MDSKILLRPAYNLDNTKLETAMADYNASKNDRKKLEDLTRIFRGSQVIVPVAFPKKADVRVVMKMLNGLPLKKGEGFPLFPLTVTDSKGNKYAPAFTSRDKIVETKDFPYMIRVPAAQVIDTVMKSKTGLDGVMLNSQTAPFIFHRRAFEVDFSVQAGTQGRQVKKVTKEEFVVIARNTVEKGLIPKTLFSDKAEFVRDLEERGAELLREMYAKPYGDKIPSPYTAEDFSVMSLNISEDTMAVCVELPQKNLAPHMARSAYVIYNPQSDEVYYYMIEKGQRGESDVLCNITPEGKHQELMTAPPVGNELTAVLDLIREEKEEAGK